MTFAMVSPRSFALSRATFHTSSGQRTECAGVFPVAGLPRPCFGCVM